MGVVATRTVVRRDPGRVLWLVTGLGWLATLGLMAVPGGMWSMPAMAAAGVSGGTPDAPLVTVLAVFLAGWVVMVAAMMLPTTVPMARLFTVVVSEAPSRRGVLTAFYSAYLAVWLGAGVLGLAVAALVSRATAGVPGGFVLAGALAVAGAFQFSPLKSSCLTKCREPRAFLFGHYRRGVPAAWTFGVRHALDCLGCCWALMAVMFTVGSGGLLWMLGLTAAMVAEKTAPWGRRLVKPLGVALLVGAVVAAVLALPELSNVAPVPAPMPGHHHM